MKEKFRISLKRTLAFISALTIITSAVLLTGFAEDEATEPAETVEATVETTATETESSTEAEATTEQDNTAETETKSVDDYTRLFPGLTDTKLKLADPKFTEKDWYEYIEYEFYTDVKDGDMTYRIYQPTDYGAASIMAITDYNPKEVLGGTSSITMNLGELQGILDIAAQGGNISKEFVGLDLATGIASQMNSINEVMDNSKYYSKSSFLGIPGDKKYTGVSNNGFFNANSLDIEIIESETVSAGKTISMNSNYSVSETYGHSKDYSYYREVGSSKTEGSEDTTSVGFAISDSISKSEEISQSISEAIGYEIISETSKTLEHRESKTDRESHTNGVQAGLSFGQEFKIGTNMSAGVEADAGVVVAGASANASVGMSIESGYSFGQNISSSHEDTIEHENTVENSVSVTDSLSVGESREFTNEVGRSSAISSEQSIQNNVDNSHTDLTSIENSLTNGSNKTTGEQHALDTAVDLGYGVDYQYGNEHSLSIGVTRTFNAREDKEVKNVGWKLCEYVVKIPYYIEAVKTDSDGTERVLYGQYVNYNLLNGVSRVFANGYIEHWYTGELVTYADFFDGFITATELVDMAQEQQKAKLPEEAK